MGRRWRRATHDDESDETGPTLSTTVSVPVVGDTTVEPNDDILTGHRERRRGRRRAGTATSPLRPGANVNEEGTSFAPDGALWAGNGSSATQSYLGLRFAGVTIPVGATVTSARIELTAAMTQ